ncbi:hypothetical protein L1887_49898 [Cichorium endivia]|nr:hypothetical protein L1887_49898 [Cichorium endivia]
MHVDARCSCLDRPPPSVRAVGVGAVACGPCSPDATQVTGPPLSSLCFARCGQLELDPTCRPTRNTASDLRRFAPGIASSRRCVMGSQRPRLALPRLVEIRAVLGSSKKQDSGRQDGDQAQYGAAMPRHAQLRSTAPAPCALACQLVEWLEPCTTETTLSGDDALPETAMQPSRPTAASALSQQWPSSEQQPCIGCGQRTGAGWDLERNDSFFLLFARIKIAIIIIHARSTQLNCAAAPSSRDHLS